MPLDGTSLDSSLMGTVDLSAMQILAVESGTVSEVSISNLCTLLQVVRLSLHTCSVLPAKISAIFATQLLKHRTLSLLTVQPIVSLNPFTRGYLLTESA